MFPPVNSTCESATKNSPAVVQLGVPKKASTPGDTAISSCSTSSKPTKDATSTFSKAPRPSPNPKSIEVTPRPLRCGSSTASCTDGKHQNAREHESPHQIQKPSI